MTIRSGAPALVWFRQDLRLSDNPALAEAMQRGSSVIPVFIWAPEEEGAWPPGAASRWWLGRSLVGLNAELERRGSRLIVRRGPSKEALGRLVAESGATAVYWNRRYEPAVASRDAALSAHLRGQGLLAEGFNGSVLFDPQMIRNQNGQPFRVFTAFWRACLTRLVGPSSNNTPKRLAAPVNWPHSLALPELSMNPPADWTSGHGETWQPGESGAHRQLKRFLEEALSGYPSNRDRPALVGTSRLSPHLHFGEISPGQVWRAVLRLPHDRLAAGHAFLRQIGWREFAYHLLHHHLESPHKPLRPEFAAFPWRHDAGLLKAWRQGRTGYPLVDAGMRELRHTGWMHNRVRMVVASFLVKHLLIDWQEGAAWFWDTLVDADLANNTLGWQWVAGCGADAAPYFRIFNPALQAARFDPGGEYVRRWALEPGSEAAYPPPIVAHDEARHRALAALASMKKDL
ncbi:MAG: deoxyribodipyrimidine photo-lyase [Acidobacteria bacterium]|nr:deoxyribodipyrimidine photo-lyase [Acidobacteriota bacterium]